MNESDIFKFIRDNNIKVANKGYKDIKCFCPFHSEKTPSFFINKRTGEYHCFGCSKKGRIRENETQFIPEIEQIQEIKKIKPIVFEDYISLEKSVIGMQYWNKRGFTYQEAVDFDMRYNIKENRVAFQVLDVNDKFSFFVERSIFNGDKRYYITDAAKKSLNFFNLKNARKYKEIVIVEGTFDAVAVGLNCMALLGKTISEQQIDILRSVNFNKVTLSLDNSDDVKPSELMELKNKLMSYFDVELISVPKPYKDWAEMREQQSRDNSGE